MSRKTTVPNLKINLPAVKKGLKFGCCTTYLVVFLPDMSELGRQPQQTNIVIFASGRGSNAAAIIHYFKQRKDVAVVAIVCNNPNAGVLAFAENESVPVLLVTKESFPGVDFFAKLDSLRPDWIVLAGFLWKIPDTLVSRFEGRMINLHPALLPNYGGKGMYGNKVHEAVVAAREKQSGITIHFVNEHYDEGNIILQAHCPVLPEDDALTLAAKIAGLEHFYLPRVLEYLIESNKE